jgi:acetyl esterase/lipase
VPVKAVPARTADLSGLSPTWIGVGDIDLFYPESVAYKECLRFAGVPPGVKRPVLRSRVNGLLTQSCSAAGSRSIMFMVRKDGIAIGRFNLRKLMSEMTLIRL